MEKFEPTGATGAAMRKARHPQKVLPPMTNAPPIKYEKHEIGYGVLFEKDIAVPMRDGIKLYCDMYRPTSGTPTPTIVLWARHLANMVRFARTSSRTWEWTSPDSLSTSNGSFLIR